MEKKSMLYCANRITLSSMGAILTIADLQNRQRINSGFGPFSLGELTNHIGSVPGFTAGLLGFGLAEMSSNYLNPRISRLIKIILPAILWSTVVVAEMTGFLNVADIKDLPAETIAFLGAASLLDIAIRTARKDLSKSST